MPIIAAFRALSLAGKIGSVLGLVAVLGGLLFAFGRWKDSIRDEGRAEVHQEWKAARDERAAVSAEFQTGLTAALKPTFDRLDQRITDINGQAADINVRLPQAIAAAPRYRDPNCALTPEALVQVNAARRLSEVAQ